MRRAAEVLLGLLIVAFGFFGILMLVASSGSYLVIPMLLLFIAASAGIVLRQLLKADSGTWPRS